MTERASVQALEDLGFTTVEAEVYIHLLHNSPATGYQIAMGINRTKGATYKVLASLAVKGAVEHNVLGGRRVLWAALAAGVVTSMEQGVGGGVVSSSSLLLAALGSFVSEVTLAVLVNMPAVGALRTMVSSVLPPLARSPRLQVTTPDDVSSHSVEEAASL